MTPALPRMPEALRPRASRPGRRRRRRGVVLLAALPVLALVLPLWRVERVTVAPCPGVPGAARANLALLTGQWVPLLDLHWVRRQVSQWPSLSGAEVELELPGTVRVVPHAGHAAGSLATGRRWHAVAADGELGGALSAPVAPLLKGFRPEPAARRVALTAAARLAAACGRRPQLVRQILPDDLLVVLAPEASGAPSLEVHVTPSGTAAERSFCALLADGSVHASWADLRRDDRMTLGGVS